MMCTSGRPAGKVVVDGSRVWTPKQRSEMPSVRIMSNVTRWREAGGGGWSGSSW